MDLQRKESGFTLIELITVIAVFAILAGISGYSYLSGLPDRKLMAASRDLYSAINSARSMAVSMCENISIVFDTKSNACTFIDSDGNLLKKSIKLPGCIEIYEISGREPNTEDLRYTYNSRGIKANARSGTVRIKYHRPGYMKMGVRVTSAGGISVISDSDSNW
jgi:prepilin-type N-terminal cleavage/methylation domain-containing protein